MVDSQAKSGATTSLYYWSLGAVLSGGKEKAKPKMVEDGGGGGGDSHVVEPHDDHGGGNVQVEVEKHRFSLSQ